MKKSLFLSVAAFTLFSANNPAIANRSESEAYNIAKKALPNASLITLANVNTNLSDTLYYTFKGANGGYAIVSAKEQTPALLAYNKNKGLSQKEAEHIGEFLSTYFNNLSNLQLKRSTGNNHGLKLSKLTGCSIAPLLGETAWGQQEPYNQNCPNVGGELSPTGCVATAMAQVMNYHKHPATIQADIPGYTTTTYGVAVDGISKGTKIDWANILDVYDDGFSKANAEAVANLTKAVGASVKMDYKIDESSANAPAVVELPLYFGYDADLIRRAFRSSFSLEEWYDIIYNELKEKRPVLMTGSTMKSGHRFVCDGIDEDGLFHINWGWDGDYNGYYDLTVLNPNTTSEVGASSSKDGYTKENSITIGITPDNGKKDARTSTNVESVLVKHQVTNGFNYLFYTYSNPYATNETVYVASGYLDENGEVVLVGTASITELEAATNYEQQNATSINTSTFKEGKLYKVGLMESLDNKTWTPCEGYNNVSVTFTKKDGKVVVASEYKLSADFEVTDYNQEGTTSYGVINLRNDGDIEYYNVVYLMTNSVNENPMKYSYAATVTVEPNNTNQLEVSFIPQTDTTYYWIMDRNTQLLKEGFVVKGNETYKLSGSAILDTLKNGSILCRVTLTNSGKSLYNGKIDVTLLHDDGSVTNHQDVLIKAGATTEVTFDVEEGYNYYHYVLTDNNENFASGSLAKKENNGKTTLYNNYSAYHSEGDTIKGFVTISNYTANTLESDLKLTVSKTKDSEQFEVLAEEVTIKPNNLGIYDYESIALADSFYYHIFVNGKEVMTDMFLPTTASTNLVKASQDINIEVVGQNLVVKAVKRTALSIFTATGSCIERRELGEGETVIKTLKQGIYLVNGKKVIIR